jgi:signal transduction histidine kinase
MTRLEVWDTGIGIAADRLEEIFEEFHRIDTAGENGYRGAGLGLSIVRRSADLLNHKVSVCSSIGHGSMFSITVPRHQMRGHGIQDQPEPSAEERPGLLSAESTHPATENDPL